MSTPQIVCLLAAVFLALAAFFALREPLTRVFYPIRSQKLGKKVRFILFTDLHSTRYGKNGEKLLSVLQKEKPDAVLFSGDIVDDRKPRGEVYEVLCRIAKAFPCYYATGNHEYYQNDADVIKEDLRARGFHVLTGSGEVFTAHGEKIYIAGVDDPQRYNQTEDHHDRTIAPEWEAELTKAKASCPDGCFSILLSHRPELVSYYQKSGFDLILSGHAHGGQARLPFINGLYAPHQGLFPKYAGGLYRLSNTSALIVSRGLCKNWIPRIFNPPEYVVIELC